MKSIEQATKVALQILLVIFHRHAIAPRHFPSLQSAKRIPQQLVIEQRKKIVENLFGMRCRSFGDALQTIQNRTPATACGRLGVFSACWPDRLPCTGITRLAFT